MGVPSVTTLVLEWEVVVERDLGDWARGKKMTWVTEWRLPRDDQDTVRVLIWG